MRYYDFIATFPIFTFEIRKTVTDVYYFIRIYKFTHFQAIGRK
jgi:hypothetical protein